MSGEEPGKSVDPSSREARDEDLARRLESLESRLGKQKTNRKEAEEPKSTKGDRAGIGQAFRLSSEFIAGIVVGAVIGYAIDQIFGTTPWGMIIFFMLGFAAAILNVLRAAGMVAESGLRLHKVPDQSSKLDEKDN